MTRRGAVLSISLALVLSSLPTAAQQPGKLYRIGQGLTIPPSVLIRASEVIQWAPGAGRSVSVQTH